MRYIGYLYFLQAQRYVSMLYASFRCIQFYFSKLETKRVTIIRQTKLKDQNDKRKIKSKGI